MSQEHIEAPFPAASRRRMGPFLDPLLRRPVLTVMVIAMLARLLLIAGLNAFADGTLFVDDMTYRVLATQMASGTTDVWAPAERLLYDTTKTFLVPLTLVYEATGPSLVAGQVLVALFAAVAAGATTRLGLEVLGPRGAVAAGLVVALLPSQILFSSVILKDAAVWAVLALLALAVAVHGRLTGWRLLASLSCIGVLYVLLANLRVHTLIAAAWAAAAAASLVPGPARVQRGLGVLGLTVAIPLMLGLGPGGLTFVTDAVGTLDELRARNAEGAATAFVTSSPTPTPTPSSTPTASASSPATRPPTTGATEAPRSAPATELPRVEPTEPSAAEPAPDSQQGVRALLRGLSAMLIGPFPAQAASSRRLQLALAENLLWWPLLALALVGALAARRCLRVLAFPVLCGGSILLLYAASEGNFGTAYRHRGEIVWAIGILAACGARRVLSHHRNLRSRQ